VALVLAVSIPLFYVLLAVVKLFSPGLTMIPEIVEMVDDITKILIGGLIGWISRNTLDQ